MPVEFVGGLFARNQYSPRQGGSEKLDLEYLRDLARAHEHAGFDRVLIANGGGDPAYLAAYAASQTERLGFMIAHRPALMAPTIAARAYATLDHITGGRIRLHAITGHIAEPEHGETLADKAQRYQRTGEYLDIVRRLWTSDKPFDYAGKFFQLKDASIPLKPLQQPHIPISLGGSSDGAYEVAVHHTDLYALWAEPLADVAERIAKLRRVAESAGVPAPRVSLSARLIIGPTEEIAWQRAHEIVAKLKANHQASAAWKQDRGHAGGALRQQEIAARGDRHDRALYMATSTAIGTGADTTSLVGTPETIVQSLLDYYDIGVTTFLNRGYEPLYDAIDYGRWIISAVREEVRRRDKQKEKAVA
ncbi:LLM class flavin-dependent oxidoreductase [Methylobacillus sp.]|uniref:LLM class flavin-dependent oxidoreductase n=1 Tax=Methylobacillus sp. TaxID=56818 RepID=UPI0012BF8235|nr:LLM class flavin-dependent oxidoreductase [Methylobacillus sp.]MPS48307.1 LLM class flavin-dependent oxidoreductase [Methylobacillus sp.]